MGVAKIGLEGDRGKTFWKSTEGNLSRVRYYFFPPIIGGQNVSESWIKQLVQSVNMYLAPLDHCSRFTFF